MKALKVIKRIVFTLIAVVYFSFALCMTILLLNYNKYGVTQFGEITLVKLTEKVSFEGYKKGDLVIVEADEISEYKKGDTVFTYYVDKDRKPHIKIGVVGEVYPDDEAITFENGNSYSREFIAGKPTKVYNDLGGYLSVVESRWGFLFIVLVPCFLIFIYEVYALIVEIKYGAEEN